MHQRAGSGEPPSDRGVGPRGPGLGPRRVVWGAFAVSVALHVVLVVVYPLWMGGIRPDAPGFRLPPAAGPPAGTRVIRLVEIDETPDPTTPDEPEEIEELEEPEATPDLPEIEGIPGLDVFRPGPTAAERLRPRLVDPRIWGPADPAFTELTPAQREELILAGRLEEWYDSVAAALAAEEALTDWTFTDDDGGRWGISPGKIHLGDITLPLPLSFGTPVGKRDETARRVWEWEEIDRQRVRAEVEESWRERAEAIRARRDLERSEARPDTTRSRR